MPSKRRNEPRSELSPTFQVGSPAKVSTPQSDPKVEAGSRPPALGNPSRCLGPGTVWLLPAVNPKIADPRDLATNEIHSLNAPVTDL